MFTKPDVSQDLKKKSQVDALIDKAIEHHAKKGIMKTREEMLALILSKGKPKAKNQESCTPKTDQPRHPPLSSITLRYGPSFIISSSANVEIIYELFIKQQNIHRTKFIEADGALNLVVTTSESVLIWNTETWENLRYHISQPQDILYFQPTWLAATQQNNSLSFIDIKSKQFVQEFPKVQCYCQNAGLLYLILKDEDGTRIQILRYNGTVFVDVSHFINSGKQDFHSMKCAGEYIIATTQDEIVGWSLTGDVVLILALNNDTTSPLILHNATEYSGRIMICVGLLQEQYATYTVIVSLNEAGSFTDQRFLSEVKSSENPFVSGYYLFSGEHDDQIFVHNVITSNVVAVVPGGKLSSVHSRLPVFVTFLGGRIKILRIKNNDDEIKIDS